MLAEHGDMYLRARQRLEQEEDETSPSFSIQVESWVSETLTFPDFEESTMTTAVMKRGDVETYTVYVVACAQRVTVPQATQQQRP
jgi:hypothetical protein